jgi:hypothetical protein
VQLVQARARTISTLRHPKVPDHGLVGRIRRHIHGEIQACGMGAADAPLSACRFHLHGERVKPVLIYTDAQQGLLAQRRSER